MYGYGDDGDFAINNEIYIQNRGVFTDPKSFRFAVNSETGEKITLGEGSFGFVMLICQTETNELFALKLIPLNSIETVTQRDIVERETRVHPELRHPFIIKMHDAFLNKGAIYIILEYAVNKTVADSYLSRFVYDEGRAFKYFYQACLAIDYLHKKGIMHRDIKPENLLLDDKDNIKLCDFGWCEEIAKANRGQLCGTFEYMAPEIIMQKDYDYRIDLWQLGILLYELLHGRTPFKAPAEMDLKDDDRLDYFKTQITQGRIVFDDHISESAVHLISSMLVYVPEKRLSLSGVLAHIWVFQMKVKLQYLDSEEILQQLSEADQSVAVRKKTCEDTLHSLQIAKRRGVAVSEFRNDFVLEEDTENAPSEQWDEDMNERDSHEINMDRSFQVRETMTEKTANQSVDIQHKETVGTNNKQAKASSVYARQLNRMVAGKRGLVIDLHGESQSIKSVVPTYFQRSLQQKSYGIAEEEGVIGNIFKSQESRMSIPVVRQSQEGEKKSTSHQLPSSSANQTGSTATAVGQQKNGLLRMFQ